MREKSATTRLAAAACLGVCLAAGIAQPAAKAAPARPPAAEHPAVEPESLQALEKMSAYLSTLSAFEITSQASLDIVTEKGQRIQLDGVALYKVKGPNQFVIDVATGLKKRRYIYDGKRFTLYAPELGYYAVVDAPPTIRQTLDLLWDRFGIALPLEDLFRWTDPASRRREAVTSGFDVGPATIDGVQTEQYAFREGDADWQVWIEKGDRPLPRKLVIVDHQDPANPAYSARLTWNLTPNFTPADFDFRPGAKDKPIQILASRK